MRRVILSLLIMSLVVLVLQIGTETSASANPEKFISDTLIGQAAAPSKLQANRAITITMFLVIIGLTLYIVAWAAKRTKTAADFYAAKSSITGTQNGWAIAGDYMSAASFLGIAGLISLYGYDGFMYSVGWLVAYVTCTPDCCRALSKCRQIYNGGHSILQV